MTPRTTVNDLDVDEGGLDALCAPRDDLVLEAADAPEADGRAHHFTAVEGPFVAYDRRVEATPLPDGRFRVHEVIEWDLSLPLWGFLFRPAVSYQLRRRDAPIAAGIDEPAAAPWWSPPARLDAHAINVIGMLCGLSMLYGYLGTTLTQTMTFAAKEFGANSTAQGDVLSAVRLGVLLSLVLVSMSDRRGRHRLILWCSMGGIVMSTIGAFAPSLAALGATQLFARAFATALGVLLGVVSVEEMPAGARAYAASVIAMTAALGAGGAVMLTALADGGESVWRIVYFAPLLVLPFFLRLARRLPESRRFERRHVKVPMRGHRGRLLLLSVAQFGFLVFAIPASSFQNEYLRTEHGFSAPAIALFTILTATPGGIGIVIGGRLADLRGRRLVGAASLVGGTLFGTLGYFVGGVGLWVSFLMASVVGAAVVPALGVYGPELFPTSLRGKANGIITAVGVAGSALGLSLAGRLDQTFDALGPGILCLAIGPVLVAILVLARFPETANIELEVLNPEDALGVGGSGDEGPGATAFAPPMR